MHVCRTPLAYKPTGASRLQREAPAGTQIQGLTPFADDALMVPRWLAQVSVIIVSSLLLSRLLVVPSTLWLPKAASTTWMDGRTNGRMDG